VLHSPRSGQLEEMFWSENAFRTISAHNKHKQHGRVQYSSTCTMVFGELAMCVDSTFTDESGLGRWCGFRVKGKGDVATRIITAYQPCHSPRNRINTVYSQHLRYFEAKGIHECPRKLMTRDLGEMLRKWRSEGDRLIVFLDANKDLTRGHMHQMLSRDGLLMREATRSRHPHLPKTGTFCRGDRVGRNPVDGCYLTPDLPEVLAGWIPTTEGPGDHRIPIVEFEEQVALGENMVRIVRPPARRLLCGTPKALAKYNSMVKDLMQQHKLLPKLHDIYSKSTKSLTETQATAIEEIDKVRTELMHCAKK